MNAGYSRPFAAGINPAGALLWIKMKSRHTSLMVMLHLRLVS